MCGERYIYRRARLDEEIQPQDKRTFDSKTTEQALLDVLLERMRAFERLRHSSCRSKVEIKKPKPGP